MNINQKDDIKPISQTKRIHIAKLILQAFMNRSEEEQDLTIEQYLAMYSSRIPKIADFINKQEEQLLVAEYLHLRTTLQRKIDQNNKELVTLRTKVEPQYQKVKQLIGKKQTVCLDILSSKLQKAKGNSDQELERVQKILANGAWGYFQKLNDRIKKLRQLEGELK